MRKVDLSEIPKIFLRGKDCNDWKNSIGKYIKFIYDGVEGELLINEYDKCTQKITVHYNGVDYAIKTDCLTKPNLNPIIKSHSYDFRLNIGDVLKDDRRNLSIIERARNKWGRRYKYKCNICGCESWTAELNLINRDGTYLGGCAGCASRKLVRGFNDIATKEHWMIPFFKNKEDPKNLMPNHKKKKLMICPDCNREKLESPAALYNNKSIRCVCGDGFSFPEKFLNCVLKQLNLEFIWRYRADWLVDGNGSQREFDFYIPKCNLICEVDGGFHKRPHVKNKLTIDDILAIDDWKDRQAHIKGLQVIRIPAYESEYEYIKSNIDNKLNEHFDLSNINWKKCNEYATKNIVKEVCEYYECNKPITVTDVAKKLNMAIKTVCTYLKKGDEIGWCVYDRSVHKKMRIEKCAMASKLKNSKRISVYKNDEYFNTYESMRELSKKSKQDFGIYFNPNHISSQAYKRKEHYENFVFEIIPHSEVAS